MKNRTTTPGAPQVVRGSPADGDGPTPDSDCPTPDGDGPTPDGDGPTSAAAHGEPGPGPDTRAVAAARAELLTHRLDPGHGTCAGCGRPSPCTTANEAAAVVVAGGAWNSLPFEAPPAAWRAGAGGDRGSVLTRARTLLARALGSLGRSTR